MVEVLIFRIDRFSFWVGFVAGILFAWVLARALRALPFILRSIGSWIQTTRENLTTGTENRIRQDVLTWAQKQHLSAPLFALDEILVQPRLLAPAQYSNEEEHYDHLDVASLTIPYMPDWPEMAAIFGAPTLTLVEALQGGSDLIIIGQPGSGKTVALAHLASQIARRDESVHETAKLFPLLIPAKALIQRLKGQDTIDAIVQTLSSCYISPVVRPRLKGMLRLLLQSGRVLLLLDGVDELNPGSSQEIHQFVRRLKEISPQLRTIVTASTYDFAGFNKLGFVPLAVAGWDERDKQQFIHQWHQRWIEYIDPDNLNSPEFVDSLLLEKWLALRGTNHSPFDITLKTWGTFAGDLLGPGRIDLIESYIRRLTVNFSNARDFLHAIALEMVTRLSLTIQQRDAENAANRTGKAVAPLQEESEEIQENSVEETPIQKRPVSTRAVSASHLINSMLSNGLLVTYGDSILSFAHSYVMGYLAGPGITEGENQSDLIQQPGWIGKEITLSFLSIDTSLQAHVEALLEKGRLTPLHQESFQVARWMQFTPSVVSWRPAVMRHLYDILQTEFETLPLAGRAACALALSDDPNVGNLFRQLLKSPQSQIRQMAALGLGILGEPRFVMDLTSLTSDLSPMVGRAACLGLVGIGNKPAMDSVISVLLHGSEEMRRAAAESLVNQSKEGSELLTEGLTMDDLLVRRAVIYGILRAKEPEMVSLLEKTAIEDAQWVVRNAAAQALDQLQRPNPYIPTPTGRLTDEPWLINFAGKSGVGVRDEKHGFLLVLQAMEHGDTDEKFKALKYLRQFPNEDAVPRLYGAYYGSRDEVKDAAFDVIWHTACAGIELPPAAKFGLG